MSLWKRLDQQGKPVDPEDSGSQGSCRCPRVSGTFGNQAPISNCLLSVSAVRVCADAQGSRVPLKTKLYDQIVWWPCRRASQCGRTLGWG